MFKALAFLVLLTCIGACTKLCEGGYEGNRCNILSRDKFLGAWNAVDNPGNIAYKDTITEGAHVADVFVSNGFNGGRFVHPISAVVNRSTLSIVVQRPDGDSVEISGSGILQDNVLTWSYMIIDRTGLTNDTTICLGTWTR